MKFCESQIDSWCRQHADEHLSLLKTLAVIPAPSHQEDQRVAFIRDWLVENGAGNVHIDSAKNVVLSFCSDAAVPLRVYMAHTDVVFPDTTPLPLREEKDRLYAPGVGDDTANVAALMVFAKFFLSQKQEYPMLFVFNSCEEGLGNLKGVRQITQDYSGRIRELVSFDLGYDSVIGQAVGSERWEVTVTTRGGHSYSDFGNSNAIACLSGLIAALYAQPLPHFPGSTTTFNVGTISGGTSVNTIAQEASMTYEYRSDDARCLSLMKNQFHTLLEAAGTPEAVFSIRHIGTRPCGANVPGDAQQKLLKRCQDAVQSVTGVIPPVISASTDANLPLSLGIPAVSFGLYRGGGTHTREEYVEIDSLTPGLRIGLRFLLSALEL